MKGTSMRSRMLRSAGRGGPRALVHALLLASAVSIAVADQSPVTHTVVIKATSYSPLTLTVKSGETVVWRNEDFFPHTATAAGIFDSKSIDAGSSWSFKPNRKGTYAYICTFHPNMKATLRVE